ncbi:MAG: STAS domain-containing protein [Bacillota bacterium]
MEQVNFLLPDELSIYTVNEIKKDIIATLQAKEANQDLILDCSQLIELDAAGIQLLLSTAKTALQEDYTLVVDSFSAEVEVVLELAGVKEILVKEEELNE